MQRRRRTLLVGWGAELAYHAWGCLAAASEGLRADKARSSNTNASSAITTSGENPRPDTRLRAMNSSLPPELNSIPSAPWADLIFGSKRAKAGVSQICFASRKHSAADLY
jgi:hypothetical protein